MSLIRAIYIALLATMAILAIWELTAGDSLTQHAPRTNDVPVDRTTE